MLTALESGALDPESPVVIAGEEHWPTVSPDIVADGYRKRERSFGRLEDALSEVMTRDEPYRMVRSAHDYPGVPATERVYARYDGVASVTASTSGGYADTLGPVRPSSVRTPRSTDCRRPTGSRHPSPTRWGSGSRCASPNPPRWTASRSRWASTGSPAFPSVGFAWLRMVRPATPWSTRRPGSSTWAWTAGRSTASG